MTAIQKVVWVAPMRVCGYMGETMDVDDPKYRGLGLTLVGSWVEAKREGHPTCLVNVQRVSTLVLAEVKESLYVANLAGCDRAAVEVAEADAASAPSFMKAVRSEMAAMTEALQDVVDGVEERYSPKRKPKARAKG